MNRHDHPENRTPRSQSGDSSSRRAWWAFGGFAALSLILLAVEHRTHLLGWVPLWWPWLFLLACPLLHVFMHGGHGGHGSRSNRADDK